MRERILRAALELIGEHGIAGVTNRNLARAAGVSLGSITYHFATQTELLRASLLLFVEEEVARLQTVAAELRDAGAAAAEVEAIVRSVGPRAQIAQFELYLAGAREPELRDAVARCYTAYDDVAAATLAALGIPDAARLAPALVALVDGRELRRLAHGEAGEQTLADALGLLVGAQP